MSAIYGAIAADGGDSTVYGNTFGGDRPSGKTASVIVSVSPAGHLVIQTRPVSGAPCPTCGKPVAKSQAQRSREWRARRKAQKDKLLKAIFEPELRDAQ